MEYNIGDIVTIKQVEAVAVRSMGDPTAWMKRKSSTAGKTATIVDKMFSEAESKFLYRILIEGESIPRAAFYTDEDFKSEDVDDGYRIDTKVLDNVCVVIIYRNDGGCWVEVSRGHGHRIHEGEVGIIQAFSYAIKKAYEKINGGTLNGGQI